MHFTPGEKPALSTVVQNIVIKIQADPNRTKQMIQKMDWEALNALINK